MTDNSDKKHSKDRLYSQPRESIMDFVFDASVVDVFDDMIGRSVPAYRTLLSMFPVISREFVKDNTNCYDLGCSLGASTLAIHQGIERKKVKMIAVDNSPAMLDKFRNTISDNNYQIDLDIVLQDICETDINNASLVGMNFTLQFIEEKMRPGLIKRIYDGINKGGVFVLSEKIKMNCPVKQDRLTQLHHAFKKANGYSDLEISQKRAALEKVLIPETIESHKTRLEKAGFSEVIVWFQCFNFVSLLAIK